jgi:hypothetical protein
MIDLSKLSFSIFLGYAISWAYFFLTLSAANRLLGPVYGAAINYVLSWIVWIVASYCIKQFVNRDSPVHQKRA